MTHFGGNALFYLPEIHNWVEVNLYMTVLKLFPAWSTAIMLRNRQARNCNDIRPALKCSVINGLTDQEHPCQLLADMQTYFEYRGDIKGKTVTWIGDGNNMCHSYIHAQCYWISI